MKDKKANILLVTNYYPPEKGAAPNRIQTLAENLSLQNYNVTVICPLPNYPTGSVFNGFKGKVYHSSIEGSINIKRLWLFPSKSSNKFIRLLSMLSFSFSLTLYFIFKKIPKKVFVQYSPVFVGFTAVFWSWVFRKKVLLNVSDLWPLAGLEMGLLSKGVYYSLLEKMEVFCYKKAKLIIGQSEEILQHISQKGIQKELFLYRNLPNFKPQVPNETSTEKITLVYAGLLGIAQGLHSICSTIKLPKHIELHIYGAGPEVEKIKSIKQGNVMYHGEVSRAQLHTELQKYTIAFVPLVKRIYGSVPSKIFEYTRLGLPIFYFAGGEGGDLVEKHRLGWNIQAEDYEAFQKFINRISKEELNNFKKSEIQKRALSAFNFEVQFKFLLKAIQKI
ncbi:glycosyltransferase family 4 protein [Patiriisocius hiemis]|uniref:Glycosyltransferase family 4 protein n=1 Tax=Patiriisocius hiemis TaxID=3075604 RepID=A0ABU2YBJ9_9FLAO|nr:glycosyltransferase family 4 protein [Constantimarinum sp. W242]MDT0555558.1 glycosyltransferase family 4 protein [Constantimarinum sp. W242]